MLDISTKIAIAAERDDNADAIIYGLRTVIGALKADKNSDER
jgi:hypothetical protein